MNPRLLETFLSLLSASVLALAGDLVLGRRSSRFSQWVESFLVGAGVSAAALFPLSLALPGRALGALAALLAAAALLALRARWRSPARTAAPPARTRAAWNLLSLALGAVTVLAALAFAALNWRYVYLWDGFQIWAAKAQLLFFQGDLKASPFPGDYMNLKLAYPPLVPMFEALLSLLRGGFDFDALKPVFLVFYLAMVVGTWRAAAVVSGRTAAFGATAILCLLPPVSTGAAAGGYADIPQAAFVAGALCAFLAEEGPPGWRSPAAWVIGGLSTVKQEGTVLTLLCLAAAGLSLLMSRRRGSSVQFAPMLSFLAPPALFLGLRVAYLRWVNIPDLTYAPVDGSHLLQALERIPEVALHCGRALFDWSQWGLLWAAFAAALLVLALARGGSPKARTSAAVAAAALFAYSLPFLFTNWEPATHIGQAYPRLLSQLAPAAVVVVAAAYARLAGAAPERSGSRPRTGHAKSRTTATSAARDAAPPAARPGGKYRNLTSAIPAGTCTARNA